MRALAKASSPSSPKLLPAHTPKAYHNFEQQMKMDMDCDSCHDNITPSVGMLDTCKHGMNEKVCTLQGNTPEEMVHDSLTGLGISRDSHKHCKSCPMCGTGQGSSASPMVWTVVLNSLIEVQKEHGIPSVSVSPSKEELKMLVSRFVDDCSGQAVGDRTSNEEESKDVMQCNLQLWRDLLHVKGGELSVKKCSCHFT